MNIDELKMRIPATIINWADDRIDNMIRTNPQMALPGVYLKRGIKNYIDKQSEHLSKIIEQASMFLLKDGEIDMNGLFCDLMNALQDMPETAFKAGFIRGSIGKGCVRILLPDGPIWNALLGGIDSIKITSDDFKVLKDMLD